MKMTKEDFQLLKNLLEKYCPDWFSFRNIYQDDNLSDTRFMWDVFNKIPYDLFARNAYGYLNDTHITTALLAILKEKLI